MLQLTPQPVTFVGVPPVRFEGVPPVRFEGVPPVRFESHLGQAEPGFSGFAKFLFFMVAGLGIGYAIGIERGLRAK